MLEKQIIEKRQEMLDSALEYGMESVETLNISKELDLLINQSLKEQLKYRVM